MLDNLDDSALQQYKMRNTKINSKPQILLSSVILIHFNVKALTFSVMPI